MTNDYSFEIKIAIFQSVSERQCAKWATVVKFRSHVHFKSGSVLKTVLDKDVETTVRKQKVICRTAI